MWYDADIDAVMTRTARRPIPAGRVDGGEALAFGIIMAAFSVLVLGVAVNWLAAALLAFTIVFYAVIYTMWLKRWTAQNIVIGGLAGALPPLIGWASVTGSLALEPFILVLIIFFWTPPHFWALALYKKTDYTQAGIPMMPNVAGDRSTRRLAATSPTILPCSSRASCRWSFSPLSSAWRLRPAASIRFLPAWRCFASPLAPARPALSTCGTTPTSMP